MKKLLLRVARAAGVFTVCRRWSRRSLRILCYHGIWLGGEPHYGDCLYMSAARFSQRMAMLERSGYQVLPLAEAVELWESDSLPERAVVITIDDAWYGSYRHMMPVLKAHGFAATLYVTTYYVDVQRPVISVLIGFLVIRMAGGAETRERLAAAVGGSVIDGCEGDVLSERLLAFVESFATFDERWSAVERIADALRIDLSAIIEDRRFNLMTAAELADTRAAGVDLQLHTHRHRMYAMDEARLLDDLERNRREIVRATGVDAVALTHFCYPSGVYDESVFPTLKKAGIRSATTTEFGLNAPGTNPYRLKRILDCESLSDIELEARLCGLWDWLLALKRKIG